MTDDERAQYEALMAAHVLERPSGQNAKALHGALVKAAAQKLTWAKRVLDEIGVEGCGRLAKNYRKPETIVQFDFNGEVIGKATRVGSRRRSVDGIDAHQQVLITEMTWAEFDTWVLMVRRQLRGMEGNDALARKVTGLRKRAPESTGPGDALKRLGQTLEQYLEAAAS